MGCLFDFILEFSKMIKMLTLHIGIFNIFRLNKTVKVLFMIRFTCSILLFFTLSSFGLKNMTYEITPNKIASFEPGPKKIILIPLGKATPRFIKESHEQLKKYVPNIDLRKREPMPGSAYYKPRNRYRADSLIAWMGKRAKANETWIGITMNDISTTKGTNPDYGVMGLGNCPGKACVASEFRVRNKKLFFKVMIHELGHTTGLPHCPVKTCYMTDANGSDATAREVGFCGKCSLHLKKAGWLL